MQEQEISSIGYSWWWPTSNWARQLIVRWLVHDQKKLPPATYVCGHYAFPQSKTGGLVPQCSTYLRPFAFRSFSFAGSRVCECGNHHVLRSDVSSAEPSVHCAQLCWTCAQLCDAVLSCAIPQPIPFGAIRLYDFQAYAAVGWTQRHSEEGGQQCYFTGSCWQDAFVCTSDGNVYSKSFGFSVEGEDKHIAPNYRTWYMWILHDIR